MSYCIVPWLQNVATPCKIPFYGEASCAAFRYFSLACATSQMLTIQLNAWTLGNAFQKQQLPDGASLAVALVGIEFWVLPIQPISLCAIVLGPVDTSVFRAKFR